MSLVDIQQDAGRPGLRHRYEYTDYCDPRPSKAIGRAARSASAAFEGLAGERFLPFDQIDEDPSRAELDRRLTVDVLGLDRALCDAGGPMELLRRKLAAEPQIRSKKQTRVIFTRDGETSELRTDRPAPDQGAAEVEELVEVEDEPAEEKVTRRRSTRRTGTARAGSFEAPDA